MHKHKKDAGKSRARAEFTSGPGPADVDFGDNDIRKANQMFFSSGGVVAGGDRAPEDRDSSRGSSRPSEVHSYLDDSGQGGRAGGSAVSGGSQAEEAEEGDEEEEEDAGTGSIMENPNKEMRQEKAMNFRGQELMMSKYFGGEYIRTSRKELENLRLFAAGKDNATAADDRASAGHNLKHKQMRDLLINDDYDICEPANDGQMMDAEEMMEVQQRALLNKHLKCRLCSHACVRLLEIDTDFMNAYEAIVSLDQRRYGLMTDAQLFVQLMALFNLHQFAIKQQGGQSFFVTLEEVRDHFREHDITNPLRQVGERMQMEREVLRKGSKYLFVKSKGKTFWSKSNTRLFLQVIREHRADSREFNNMRAQLANAEGVGGGGGLKGKISGQKGGRHLNGAVANRRWSTGHV